MPPPRITLNPLFGPALRTNVNPPENIISEEFAKLTSIPIIQYPPDLPKYYVLLTQSNWKFSTQLQLQKAYRLPLPTRLVDAHSIQYDHNFNWLDMLKGTKLGNVIETSVEVVQGLGFSVGNFKTVTIKTPDFRTFSMEWRFAPRNAQESRTIRQLYAGIKEGMHPVDLGAGSTVLQFPSVFWLGIYPNAGWLFKTKPSVITGCQIDYQGGNPQPAFYKETTAPESVVLRLTFLELEFWISSNFKNQLDDDPFNASSKIFGTFV